MLMDENFYPCNQCGDTEFYLDFDIYKCTETIPVPKDCQQSLTGLLVDAETKLIFALEGLKQFFKLKEFNITVNTNNETHAANWVLITNAKHYAGPHSITKRTNIFNEDLICYLFQDLTKLSFLYNLFLIIFFGDLSKSKKIKTIHSSSFDISSQHTTPIQCDGEPFGHLPATIQSNKEFINLITI